MTFKLLIVDDEPFLCSSLARLLRKHQFDVEIAEHGPAALAWLTAHPDTIDLILMDLHMPKWSGEETAKRLRALDPKVKLIAMTGYTPGISPDDPTPSKSIIGLFDAFLFKPFESGGVVKTIRAVLGIPDEAA